MRIRVRLRNLSMLTIGSAYSRLGIADICTVKVGGSVLIPGSSFKGVLRSAAHRASGRLGLASCGEIEPSRISKAHERMGRVCDVCDLFGRPGPPSEASSKIIVGDLKPVDARVLVLGRTSIDASRGKALEGSLRTVEAIPPCTIFEGEILLLSEDRKHLTLILEALDEIRYGNFGRGSLVDVIAEIDEESEIAKSLSNWRWDICP
jgi:CRISPR/Cas system CSM-associated protein Csm3 (group 7 of RAMP superfamily)